MHDLQSLLPACLSRFLSQYFSLIIHPLVKAMLTPLSRWPSLLTLPYSFLRTSVLFSLSVAFYPGLYHFTLLVLLCLLIPTTRVCFNRAYVIDILASQISSSDNSLIWCISSKFTITTIIFWRVHVYFSTYIQPNADIRVLRIYNE